MNFIELTTSDGTKFIGNINLLQRVADSSNGQNGNAYVVGWNNNGGFYVRESYEEIIEKINSRLAGTNRLHWGKANLIPKK
jgi:uncharacterized protein YlzI (FlbEa/FlbD family)